MKKYSQQTFWFANDYKTVLLGTNKYNKSNDPNRYEGKFRLAQLTSYWRHNNLNNYKVQSLFRFAHRKQMPPNMIGAYLENNLHDPERGDLFVKNEINTTVYRVSEPEDKEEADRVIQEASITLRRPLPPPHRMGPLYRKYHKVKMTTTTYTFGILETNRREVRGMQGWSVQMALQLEKNVFVYDDLTLQWYKGDRFEARLPEDVTTVALSRFKPCDPPTLDQKSNISLPVSLGIHTSQELEKLLERKL